MSLSILVSKVASPRPDAPVAGTFVNLLREKNSDGLGIEYAHTTRKAPAIIDVEGQTEETILATKGPQIFNQCTDDEGTTTFTFAGTEHL